MEFRAEDWEKMSPIVDPNIVDRIIELEYEYLVEQGIAS